MLSCLSSKPSRIEIFVFFLAVFTNSAYDIRPAKLSSPREEARVPPAGLALRLSFGVFSYACACLAVSDPNIFASCHLPTHPPPPAHKTFIRAQPCAARNVCLNKLLSLRLTLKIFHQLCKLAYLFFHYTCVCVCDFL